MDVAKIQAQLTRVNKAFNHKESPTEGGIKAAFSQGKSLQRITYGAPGTGKSWGIEELVKNVPDQVVRTTFHPDSDYSTFVGAYKPTMETVKRTYVNEGVEKDVVDGEGHPVLEKKIVYDFVEQAFTKAYVKAWKAWAAAGGVGGKDPAVPKEPKGVDKAMVDAVAALIEEKGAECVVSTGDIIDKFLQVSDSNYAEGSAIPTDYCYNRVNAGTALDKPKLFEYVGSRKFKCLGLGAAFTGDVMRRPAGAKEDQVVGKCENGVRMLSGGADPIYLVIEEINRGNCAQAFGDIFQLLDRDDNGYSKYPVDADRDLARHLKEAFAEKGNDGSAARDHLPPEIADGTKLRLPPNLCIWATMNTSDQSLFPMDSAFKRRWDWEYKPIIDGKKGWFVKVDVPEKKDDQGKVVAAAQTLKYDWWTFLKTVNGKIYELTDSEDKELGYYFVKAGDDKVISAETFVGKVIFYLWNDVYKDYGIAEIFKGEKNGETADGQKEKGVPFRKFYDETDPEGKKIDVNTLVNFFKAVGVEPEK